MLLRVIMVGAMPALTKNPGFATGTGRLLERERKMLKKSFDEFLPVFQDPLAGPDSDNGSLNCPGVRLRSD